MSALDRMFNNPVAQIEQLIVGTNILRKNETLSPEYREAFELLEPYGVYMTARDGDDVLVLTIGAAADLIADHYVRRASSDNCPDCGNTMEYVGTPDGNSGYLHCWECAQ